MLLRYTKPVVTTSSTTTDGSGTVTESFWVSLTAAGNRLAGPLGDHALR